MTVAQIRRQIEDARAERSKVLLAPEVAEMLLDAYAAVTAIKEDQ